MPCTYHHLQGPSGLCEAITKILASHAAASSSATVKPQPILVFDFDRTLTNGFASPSHELPVERRIRGGEQTLHALRRAKREGLDMFIITARSPSKLTIEQLEASMKHCQQELAELFIDTDSGHDSKPYHIEKINGRPLAWRGNLFAADYAKPIALQQILLTEAVRQRYELVEVHFFDDFVMNAFDIGVMDYGSHVSSVSAYWWDTFLEEQSGQMGLVNTFSSDFTYQKGTEAARQTFGLSDAVSEERQKWYEQYEQERNIVKPPSLKEELPPPAPVSADVKKNLGSLLAFRTRPPVLPPPDTPN